MNSVSRLKSGARYLISGVTLVACCSDVMAQSVPASGRLTGLWSWGTWTPTDEANGPDRKGPMGINDSGVVVGIGNAYSLVNVPLGSGEGVSLGDSQEGPLYQHTDLTVRMMEPRNYLAGYLPPIVNPLQVAAYNSNHANQFNLPYPTPEVCAHQGACDSSEESLRSKMYIGGAYGINNTGRVVGYIGDGVNPGWAGSPSRQYTYQYY